MEGDVANTEIKYGSCIKEVFNNWEHVIWSKVKTIRQNVHFDTNILFFYQLKLNLFIIIYMHIQASVLELRLNNLYYQIMFI